MSESELPNPFECARRVIGVNVILRPDDITDVWGSLSKQQAEKLLDQHASSIAAQMLTAGISAAVQIMRQEGGEL
jgi:hypothetical protein